MYIYYMHLVLIMHRLLAKGPSWAESWHCYMFDEVYMYILYVFVFSQQI